MKQKFSKISNINVSVNSTWMDKLFLSFDLDWAHEEIILDCYDLVSSYNVNSTWFVTHPTDFLNFNHDKIELGIHPNFNNLLNGNNEDRSPIYVMDKLLKLVPSAKTLRSHSLAQSERLLDTFTEVGITHVSNMYIPYSSKIITKPFNVWDNITIVPHVFQDNAAIRMNELIQKNDVSFGFHVFDFHPIHVYLNTEDINRYEETRDLHYKPKELIKYRYEGYGTRNKLIDLLESTA